MRLEIKDLQQHTSFMEVEETITVAQLKQRVAEERNVPMEAINFVFGGARLSDDKPISEYNIKDGSRLILFVKKPKQGAPTANQSQAQAAASEQPAAPAQPATTWGQPKQPEQPTSSAAPAPSAPSQPAPVDDSEKAKLDNLEAMGYDRTQAQAALRAAFGDVNGAVEYLTNGIPDDLSAAASQQPFSQPASSLPSSTDPTPSASPLPSDDEEVDPAVFDNMTPEQLRAHARASEARGAAGLAGLPLAPPTAEQEQAGQLNHILHQLRTNPSLDRVRQQLRQNPQLEELFLQQVIAQTPAMAPLISQHRDDFIRALRGEEPSATTPVAAPPSTLPPDLFNGMLPDIARRYGVQLTDAPVLPPIPSSGLPSQTGGVYGQNDVMVQQTPQGLQVVVSPEDKANLERIVAVTGCTETEAVQAYFACGKNVESAINLVMDNM